MYELPVRVLLDHLVDFEQEGVVAKHLAHALLVKSKLCCSDGLALWDLRQVELKLLVVTPVQGELPVVFHCGNGNTEINKTCSLQLMLIINISFSSFTHSPDKSLQIKPKYILQHIYKQGFPFKHAVENDEGI